MSEPKKSEIKIEFDDIYVDEGVLSEHIVNMITNKLYNEIWGKVSDYVKKELAQKYKDNIDQQIEIRIESMVDAFMKGDDAYKIRMGYNKDPKTFEEYIKDKTIDGATVDRNIERVIERVAKDQADSIAKGFRERYDHAFASMIVKNLNDQSMLKEDISKLLLNNNPENEETNG